MTHTTPHPRGHRTVEHLAWAFYVVAATGSTIGQIWVGVQAPPWPTGIDWWWRAVLVAPFAAVIDLGGVVTSAFADARQRLGEAAYAWRALSAVSVTTGVAINVVGHAHVPYLAVMFGALGCFAYTVWLLHAGARRRDALRASGKLAGTAPSYGLAQWRREPAITRRARSLAREHGLGLGESLECARTQLRQEQRRRALADHVRTLISSRHSDPVRAAIAVTTLDIDAIAGELTRGADVAGWARLIGADLQPPPVETTDTGDHTHQQHPAIAAVNGPVLGTGVLRRIPTDQDAYDRWRALWAELQATPDADLHQVAEQHGVSLRQVQWIRSVGPTGLLDSPLPPAVLLAQLLAGGNTPLLHPPQEPT